MKKRNFFLIGAPKCGTTSMATWLAEHSSIYMPPIKDPNYFNTDHGNNYVRTLAEYDALFEGATKDNLVEGEASPAYLSSNEAVPNILLYNPAAKFLVLVRNPIHMAYSLHDQLCHDRCEHIDDFAAAWQLQGERAAGKCITLNCPEPSFLVYGKMCRLGAQLRRLYSRVSPERVHVVIFDDLKVNPRREYQRVLAFLRVPDDGRQKFLVHNQAKERKSHLLRQAVEWLGKGKKKLGITKGIGLLNAIDRKNQRIRPRPPLKPETRQMLIDFFHDDVQLLGGLLRRDLSSWLK